MSEWQQGRVIEQPASKQDEDLQKVLDQTTQLQSGKVVDDNSDNIDEVVNELEMEVEQLAESKKRSWLPKLFFTSFTVLIISEVVMTLIAAFSTSPLLAVVYATAVLSAVAIIGKVLYREFRLLLKLKSTKEQQLHAERLMHSVQLGEAKSFLSKLNSADENKQLTQLLEQIDEHHTDKEVMDLYNKTVLSVQDKNAQDVIKKYAATSGVMVAISPIALVDMAVVLWRSTKMIEDVTKIYGLPLGYISRVRLYRMTLKQMLFAGSAELISDFATTAVSAELTGKLSARAAQGVSVSIFTARIGYKAMELSRPVPGLPNKKNLLSSCVKLALESVKTNKQKEQSGN